MIQQARMIDKAVREILMGSEVVRGVSVVPVSLIQPLECLAPALPAVWVRARIRRGGSGRNGWNGCVRGRYGETGGIKGGEGICGVWGIDCSCRRWRVGRDTGEMSGKMVAPLCGFRPGILWGTRTA